MEPASNHRVQLSLHHVGYAVADIRPMTQLYVDRFGYEVCSPIIHDPAQTAYVQFLRLQGDPAYLEFVAPDSPDSKLSQAIRKGGGLNHLCYVVDAIEEATDELRSRGMLVLAPPAPAVALNGRRSAWLCGDDPLPIELIERGPEGEL